MLRRYGHCFLGVDYSVPPHELQEAALADARNIVPTSAGLPTGRGGSTKLNSTSLGARVTSFFEFKSGSTVEQIATYSTKMGVYSAGVGDFVDEITALTNNKMFQWVNFAGKVIGVNGGNDNPQYYDGTDSGDLDGDPPKGLTVTEWSNRLWFGGDSTDVALLTGSGLNDPADYSSADETGYVSQTIGDSKDPITGIFGFFDMLLVGKRNNIYKVTGVPATDATTLKIEPLYSKSTDNIGFTSPWAITQVGNDVIFLDGYDIKRLSGIQEYGDVEHVSVAPHFRDYLETTVDKDYLQYAQFFHYKKAQQIWCSIPTGSDTHLVFVLDYKFRNQTQRYSFYPMYGLTISCFGGVEDGEITNIYYGDETGFVHKLDVGEDDNGAIIDRYFVNVVSGNSPKNEVLDRHEIRKQFQSSETFILPTESALSMTPYYAIDLMNAAQIRTSDNYTAFSTETVTGWNGTGIKHKRNRFHGLSGRTMALKWRHAAIAQNFVFYPSEIHYNWKSRNSIK